MQVCQAPATEKQRPGVGDGEGRRGRLWGSWMVSGTDAR